ncbi:hypothetical protein FC093_17455 [Ilyomonas limi]|uniref:JAB domain-containing protein n=1 Tax=Ilyomonas limi TaxID=2575867 RepID=A0A4V5UVW4_9BACT|nr:hypothetical protein FC093_17455 [Ilyomonas limi]
MVTNEPIFNLTNGGKIKLSKSAVYLINKLTQYEARSPESGGVLLGRFIKDSKNIVVDKVTTPMKGDKQTRYLFKRLSPLHQLIIDSEWNKSNGTCNYLGEWHTHPELVPTPSGIDIRDWKRKLKTDTFSSRFLYFIIAGTRSINMWEGDRRTNEIRGLEPISDI